MRVLFAIPHYYDPEGDGFYGSLGTDANRRSAAVMATVLGLYQAFDRRQGLLDGQKRRVHPTNTGDPIELSVVLCTTRGKHLVNQLTALQGLYTHLETAAEPAFLGFECHAVLQRALGAFDYYCFLEDDLLITDPQFFAKLAVQQPRGRTKRLPQPYACPGHSVHKSIRRNMSRSITRATIMWNDPPLEG